MIVETGNYIRIYPLKCLRCLNVSILGLWPFINNSFPSIFAMKIQVMMSFKRIGFYLVRMVGKVSDTCSTVRRMRKLTDLRIHHGSKA